MIFFKMFKTNILMVVQNWKVAAARIFGHVPPNFNPHAVRTGRKILKRMRVGESFSDYYLTTTGERSSFWDRQNQNMFPRSAVWRDINAKHEQIEKAAQARKDRGVTATKKGDDIHFFTDFVRRRKRKAKSKNCKTCSSCS